MRELGLGSQELFLMSLVLKNAKKAKNKIKKNSKSISFIRPTDPADVS